MGIYRCNKCGLIEEKVYQTGMTALPCAKCGHPNGVYDTVFFVQKLLERYLAISRELQALKQVDEEK